MKNKIGRQKQSTRKGRYFIYPTASKIPDGHTAMNMVFSDNAPLVEFCDRSTETGSNIQKGYMQMLAGAMSALRNPKAHANITITKDDAMRRLMFASMLMYAVPHQAGLTAILCGQQPRCQGKNSDELGESGMAVCP